MAFWDTLGDLGEGVIEYAGGIFTNSARNASSEAAQNEALAERLRINNQIALQNAETEKERSEKNQELIKTVIYIILGLICIYVIFAIVKPLIKK